MLKTLTVQFAQDHLHIRGEYQVIGKTISIDEGSPPHTWRIQVIQDVANFCNRITSTYVENTDELRTSHAYR